MQLKHNEKHLRSWLHKIIRDMAQDNWKPDYIVGLTRGGLVPATMLSHYLNVPMHTLHVSFRDDEGGPESNLWMAEEAYGYIPKEERTDAEIEISMLPVKGDTSDPKKRKKILIVDDINDTGATINWIIKDWPQGCFPDDAKWNTLWNHNVKFAAIFDNLASKADVKMDFVGREINKAENNVWIDFPFEDWWVK
jgi:xanthine phosphoribosyltransferase